MSLCTQMAKLIQTCHDNSDQKPYRAPRVLRQIAHIIHRLINALATLYLCLHSNHLLHTYSVSRQYVCVARGCIEVGAHCTVAFGCFDHVGALLK